MNLTEIISKIIKPSNLKGKVKVSTDTMEQFLGISKPNPITLTQSDIDDKSEKGDYFEEWYKQELEAMYKKYNS
ncbi:hypothetical protein FDJ70_07325 [Clostridium botulinum]|nr:hypothetical protein [Clostridium botulinum]